MTFYYNGDLSLDTRMLRYAESKIEEGFLTSTESPQSYMDESQAAGMKKRFLRNMSYASFVVHNRNTKVLLAPYFEENKFPPILKRSPAKPTGSVCKRLEPIVRKKEKHRNYLNLYREHENERFTEMIGWEAGTPYQYLLKGFEDEEEVSGLNTPFVLVDGYDTNERSIVKCSIRGNRGLVYPRLTEDIKKHLDEHSRVLGLTLYSRGKKKYMDEADINYGIDQLHLPVVLNNHAIKRYFQRTGNTGRQLINELNDIIPLSLFMVSCNISEGNRFLIPLESGVLIANIEGYERELKNNFCTEYDPTFHHLPLGRYDEIRFPLYKEVPELKKIIQYRTFVPYEYLNYFQNVFIQFIKELNRKFFSGYTNEYSYLDHLTKMRDNPLYAEHTSFLERAIEISNLSQFVFSGESMNLHQENSEFEEFLKSVEGKGIGAIYDELVSLVQKEEEQYLEKRRRV